VNKKANIVENESVAPDVLVSVAQAFEKSEYLESRIASAGKTGFPLSNPVLQC